MEQQNKNDKFLRVVGIMSGFTAAGMAAYSAYATNGVEKTLPSSDQNTKTLQKAKYAGILAAGMACASSVIDTVYCLGQSTTNNNSSIQQHNAFDQ